jgi:hypothetical protein
MYPSQPLLVVLAVVLIAMVFAPLTACGGGFVKGIVVEIVCHGYRKVFRKIIEWGSEWISLKTTAKAASIGGFGALLYVITHLSLVRLSILSSSTYVAPCLGVNATLLLIVTLLSALLGAYLWVAE